MLFLVLDHLSVVSMIDYQAFKLKIFLKGVLGVLGLVYLHTLERAPETMADALIKSLG